MHGVLGGSAARIKTCWCCTIELIVFSLSFLLVRAESLPPNSLCNAYVALPDWRLRNGLLHLMMIPLGSRGGDMEDDC